MTAIIFFGKIGGLSMGGLPGPRNTLCWKCHGLGSPAAVHELRDLAREYASTIVCVVEMQIAKYHVEGLASTLGYNHAYGVDSLGHSGGLCIYWKSYLTLRNYSKYHIDMTEQEVRKDPWRLTCWYGEANRNLRTSHGICYPFSRRIQKCLGLILATSMRSLTMKSR